MRKKIETANNSQPLFLDPIFLDFVIVCDSVNFIHLRDIVKIKQEQVGEGNQDWWGQSF